MKPIIIAIDGFSSTGKSTIARKLADELRYIYVDTGAMYRAVTYFALKHELIKNGDLDSEALIEALNDINITFERNDEKGVVDVVLNGKNIEAQIRSLNVSQNVSQIATLSEVRKKLVEQQKLMGKNKGVVMDGRDIGTVVFPNAELKIFMTASAEIRAQRRYKELIDRGYELSFEEVLENVTSRDKIDSTREDSPLIKAPDAIEIDNSDLSIEEQLENILALARLRMNT